MTHSWPPKKKVKDFWRILEEILQLCGLYVKPLYYVAVLDQTDSGRSAGHHLALHCSSRSGHPSGAAIHRHLIYFCCMNKWKNLINNWPMIFFHFNEDFTEHRFAPSLNVKSQGELRHLSTKFLFFNRFVEVRLI